MRRIIIIVILSLALTSCSESPTKSNNDIEKLSAAVIDIQYCNEKLWFGTSAGLYSTNDVVENFISYANKPGMIKGGVSALYVSDDYIFVAGEVDSQINDIDTQSAGTGLSYSNDDGQSWKYIPQPLDDENETSYQPTTSVVNNLIYDITLINNTIWVASFGGGLRRSIDFGLTWHVVTIDGIPFNSLDYLTHRLFSVISFNNEIWAGTAGGIGRSTDDGNTWEIFTHQNQTNPISGNFIVALGYQPFSNSVWASTIQAANTEEVNALSRSSNSGQSWDVFQEGIFTHNFYFEESKVFVTSNEGLFSSENDGASWQSYPSLIDSLSNIYSVCVIADSININFGIWVGGSRGIAHSTDNGSSWKITKITPGKNIKKLGKIVNTYK